MITINVATIVIGKYRDWHKASYFRKCLMRISTKMRVASPAPGIHITARPVVCSGVDRPEIIDRYLLEITHQEFQFC